MRAAYVCADPGVPVFGRKGCSVHVQELIRALGKEGVRVVLIARRLGGGRPRDLETLELHRLSRVAKGALAERERASFAANGELREALEREGPFDLVYERFSLWSFAAMEYAHTRGVPGLLEVNAPLIEEQERHRGLVHRASAEEVEARVFSAASHLLAVSEEVAQYLRERSEAPVSVMPNGVELDRFPPGMEPSLAGEPGSFTVGFVGSLKPWHGLRQLAEGFASFHRRRPQARLLIVGDGPERPVLERDLARRGVGQRAHLTGSVPPDAVPGLLASMDVAVAPYAQDSSFYFSPLKVYEYMAAARPVVVSRIGQLETLVQHGVNGLLCPPGDPVALAEAIERLYRDPSLRSLLGRSARATVERSHTWRVTARRVLQLTNAHGRELRESVRRPGPEKSRAVTV